MTSLQALKKKWFLDLSVEGSFPPQSRHPGAMVFDHTEGNNVEPVIDGYALMSDYHRRLTEMIEAPDPSVYEVWVSMWHFDDVKLLGVTNPAESAFELTLKAAEAGVKIVFLGSGHLSRKRPHAKFSKELIARGGRGTSDSRMPRLASHHQKFVIYRYPENHWVAVLGSMDISKARWDTPEHLDHNPDRPLDGQGPTHDVSLKVEGPGAVDIALHFAERWNDPKNRSRTNPEITVDLPVNFAFNLPDSKGSCAIQMLRTYPIDPKRSFSWSDRGEFTIWASYLNAIKKAQKYIYIEDQYLYSFGAPPAVERPPGVFRDSDLFFHIGEAIKRGVDVLILVPSRKGNPAAIPQLHQRRMGVRYLREISETAQGAGRFGICYPSIGKFDPVVHAKVMIVDDELALVGSANVCQRSMAHDSEVHLAVVDGEDRFVRELRLALWMEHMELDGPQAIQDPGQGFSGYMQNATEGKGRLRLFDIDKESWVPFHKIIMDRIIDPYKGPTRI